MGKPTADSPVSTTQAGAEFMTTRHVFHGRPDSTGQHCSWHRTTLRCVLNHNTTHDTDLLRRWGSRPRSVPTGLHGRKWRIAPPGCLLLLLLPRYTIRKYHMCVRSAGPDPTAVGKGRPGNAQWPSVIADARCPKAKNPRACPRAQTEPSRWKLSCPPPCLPPFLPPPSPRLAAAPHGHFPVGLSGRTRPRESTSERYTYSCRAPEQFRHERSVGRPLTRRT